MVGLTLILIATVIYGVVIGASALWSLRKTRRRAHRQAMDSRGHPEDGCRVG